MAGPYPNTFVVRLPDARCLEEFSECERSNSRFYGESNNAWNNGLDGTVGYLKPILILTQFTYPLFPGCYFSTNNIRPPREASKTYYLWKTDTPAGADSWTKATKLMGQEMTAKQAMECSIVQAINMTKLKMQAIYLNH